MNIIRAAEKLYVVDVAMHPFMIILETLALVMRIEPFCRSSLYTSIERLLKRVERLVMSEQCLNLDVATVKGHMDQTKALELYHRAAELGCMKAYFNIGCSCHLPIVIINFTLLVPCVESPYAVPLG